MDESVASKPALARKSSLKAPAKATVDKSTHGRTSARVQQDVGPVSYSLLKDKTEANHCRRLRLSRQLKAVVRPRSLCLNNKTETVELVRKT